MRLGRCGLLAALASVFILVFAAPAFASGSMPPGHIPYDVDPLLRNLPTPEQKHLLGKPLAPGLGGQAEAQYGPPDIILTLYDWDPAHGGSHEVAFWKMFTGTHSDIYVGWNDLTPPRSSSQQSHTITQTQIEYLGQEFDRVIWASDVFHFGRYQPRTPPGDTSGSFGERAAIFVYNIRDEAYWGDYRFYIAGFFDSSLNDDLGVNAIFVDSYDWANRIGPNAARPHLYEGVIAHEFQHLIHHDVDADEDSFIDEGMADLAEQFIYGTETTASHIAEYLYYHRDSLIDWKGELFDYGNAVLWQDYLWERAGGQVLDAPWEDRVAATYAGDPFAEDSSKFADPGDKFIWDLIHDQDNGLKSVADQVGGGLPTVQALFRDYTLANLLDGKGLDPKWEYRNLKLGGPDSEGYTIEQGFAYYDSSTVGGNMPPTRKRVPRTVNEAWGAYYRSFSGTSPGFTMKLTAPEKNGVAPHSGTWEWFSGMGNMLQRTLTWSVSGVSGGQLSFWTWYDIEQDWDYGYVEASTDGGATWTKLVQTSNLPQGTTDRYGSSAWDGPGGLTGNSGGWKQATYDLSGYSGDLKIRFRYATDEAVNGQGWYIDDFAVTSGSVPVASDDLTGSTPGAAWETDADAGWLYTSGFQNNSWHFDIWKPYAKAKNLSSQVISVSLQLADGQYTGGSWVDAQYQKSFRALGIVSNCPGDGTFLSRGTLTIQKSKQP